MENEQTHGPSERRLAANRQNAKKSTGPRTQKGKKSASQNARKGALYLQSFLRSLEALGEDPDDYLALFRDLVDAFAPEDAFWAKQVEDLAMLYWEQDRERRVQAALRRRQLERLMREQPRPEPETKGETYNGKALAEFEAAMALQGREWALMIRRENALGRAIDRKVQILMRHAKQREEAAAAQYRALLSGDAELDPAMLGRNASEIASPQGDLPGDSSLESGQR